MDYKQKYLKYKEKYVQLKLQLDSKIIQKGNGGEVTIPSSLPGTQSFLFMPLIYYTLDNSSVTLPDGFIQIILDCIESLREMGFEIPFTTFEEFIAYLLEILKKNGIHSIANLKLNSAYHIPGPEQEKITDYHSNEFIHSMISCLVQNSIEKLAGKKFIYK